MDWKKVKTTGQIPSPRRAHTATLCGTKIYLFGGGDGDTALNDMYFLDIGKYHSIFHYNKWES